MLLQKAMHDLRIEEATQYLDVRQVLRAIHVRTARCSQLEPMLLARSGPTLGTEGSVGTLDFGFSGARLNLGCVESIPRVWERERFASLPSLIVCPTLRLRSLFLLRRLESVGGLHGDDCIKVSRRGRRRDHPCSTTRRGRICRGRGVLSRRRRARRSMRV